MIADAFAWNSPWALAVILVATVIGLVLAAVAEHRYPEDES